MEFRYRDGDRREQAPSPMEYRYRSGDLRQQPTVIPFPGPSARPPHPRRVEMMPQGIGVGMMPQSAWREMLKEQIRQEMVSQEIAMRRELQEEVRQEMEMARRAIEEEVRREIEEEVRMEMGIQPGRQMMVVPEPHVMFRPQQLSEVRQMELPIQANPNPRIREMDTESPISEVNQSQRPLAMLPRKGVPVAGSTKLTQDGEHGEVAPNGELNQLVTLKRKGGPVGDCNEQDGERSEVPRTERIPLATTKRKGSSKAARTGEWNTHCAVCQVRTTSEVGMKEHLTGKKHQANVACLAAKGTGTSRISAFVSKRKGGNTSIVKPKASATSVEEVPDFDAKKLTLVVEGKQHVVLKKNNLLWCELCSVRCTSTELMAAHLGGKKHLARAGKPKASNSGKKAAICAGAVEDVTPSEGA